MMNWGLRQLIMLGVALAIGAPLLANGWTPPQRPHAPTGVERQQSFGGQQPPPRVTTPFLDLFIPIYGSFLDLVEDESLMKKPTFMQWCVMCGVTEPVPLSAMKSLHAWAERTGFDPRGPKRR